MTNSAKKILAAMTAEERFDYVRGTGFGIRAYPHLGLGEIRFSDASGGLRRSTKDGPEMAEEPTAFPAPVLLAAGWNKRLAFDYARAIGEECRALGFHFLLGPGLNIYRVSTCGRNFEYLGEDPFLTGQITAGYVLGLQSTGTAATLKHFLANGTDFHRRSSNSVVSPRALREIYMPGFAAGIQAGARGVMTAYNLVNGEWCGQSAGVIKGLLRGELGFTGLVMTDWDSVWHADKIMGSGQDLEMPFGEMLNHARESAVGSPEIDRMALSVLETCLAAGFYDDEFRDASYFTQWEAHRETALRANQEGIVMLENRGMFPLSPEDTAGSVLITGNAAEINELSGSGSGEIAGNDVSTYRDALTNLFGADRVVFRENPTDEELREAERVFVFTGFVEKGTVTEGEFFDRPWVLPEDGLIRRAVEANPKTAVCLVCGGGVSMDWAPRAGAAFHLFYGGQTGPAAFVSLITGEANPSGKLPFSIEKRFEDSPGYGYDELTIRELPPEEKIPHVNSYLKGTPEFVWDAQGCPGVYDVTYDEGIFVGYRWYDKKKIAPRYPFGYGLSYTRFELSDFQLIRTHTLSRFSVRVKVRNTGDRAGAEVVQLYVKHRNSTVEKPEKELKAFKKVFLQPGEVKTIRLELGPEMLRYYHEESGCWQVDEGDYSLLIGTSSAHLPGRIDINMPRDFSISQLLIE